MINWSLFRRLLGQIARFVISGLAIIFLLIEDAFWAVMNPVMAAFARLALVHRVESWIKTLSPTWILVLFIVPMVIVWPIKLVGLYVIGTGRVFVGTIIFAGAEIIGAALAVRLWSIGKHQLLSIRWFAWAYGHFDRWRIMVYQRLEHLPGVAGARALFVRTRAVARGAIHWLRKSLSPDN